MSESQKLSRLDLDALTVPEALVYCFRSLSGRRAAPGEHITLRFGGDQKWSCLNLDALTVPEALANSLRKSIFSKIQVGMSKII